MSISDKTFQSFFDNVEKLYKTYAGPGLDGFDAEFQEIKQCSLNLKQDPAYTSKGGENLENKKKNRYKDILPFDYTRVHLKHSDDITFNYINASFIKGPQGRTNYIAAQGPLPHTVNDFWKMLWDYNVRVVIMVCREVEASKKKCERYWSSGKEVKQFGDVAVSLKSEDQAGHGFWKRTLIVKKQEECRKVFQLHYNTWPDHGVPRTRDDFLGIIYAARQLQNYSDDITTPLCVHCSAGCGRTGAVIVVDYFRNLLTHQKLTSSLTVYDVVMEMRKQRPAIVQTKEQYEFVHMALVELFSNFLKKTGRKLPSSSLSNALGPSTYENVVTISKSERNMHKRSTAGVKSTYENLNLEENVTSQAIPSQDVTYSKPHFRVSAADQNFHQGPNVLKVASSETSPRQASAKKLNPAGAKKIHASTPDLKPSPVKPKSVSHKTFKAGQNEDPSAPVSKPRIPLDGMPLTEFTASIGKLAEPAASKSFFSFAPQLHEKKLLLSTNETAKVPPVVRPKPKSSGKSMATVPESIESRKQRLMSQGMQETDSNLKKYQNMSVSAFDLRSTSDLVSPQSKHVVFRRTSVEKDFSNSSNSQINPWITNTNICNTNIKTGNVATSTKSSTGHNTKPPPPPSATKPKPILPRKAGVNKSNSVKFPGVKHSSLNKELSGLKSSSFVESNDASQNSPGYVNVSHTSLPSSENAEYGQVTSQLSSGKTDTTYDILNRLDPSKKTPHFIDNKSPDSSSESVLSNSYKANLADILSPKPFTRTSLRVSSVVFDEHDADDQLNTYSHISEAQSSILQDKANSNTRTKPPLKPKRTFRKTENPFAANRTNQGYPTSEASSRDDSSTGSRSRSSSVVSRQSDSSSFVGNSSNLLGKPQLASAPAIPVRTQESYILNSPEKSSSNSYEDLDSEIKPQNTSYSRQHSAAVTTSALKAKTKELFGKTTNAISDKVVVLKNFTSSKDDNIPLKTKHLSYIHEPYMLGNQDISFGNRINRKPKGARQSPAGWTPK
ncbi:unnamed protein product [Clavelina lepadiformis]|uniref:protein-tyrosine-phosphatase n=1 Tax=Clavelina lepadiformis TaxID=159417 RepID=A0ABP0G1A7_CLALP